MLYTQKKTEYLGRIVNYHALKGMACNWGKMLPRYIWPVDFSPVRPHRMVSPGDLLRKVPADTDIWASHCWCHALRSILDSEHPNLGSRISPVYRSALTSCEVSGWSLIQALELRMWLICKNIRILLGGMRSSPPLRIGSPRCYEDET